MSGKTGGVRQISEIANGMLDPILARRAGINTMLLGSWEEIAGPEFADCTRPEQIRWDRRQTRGTVEEGGFTPGVLTVACEGTRALFLMHCRDELIERINAFFGYPAVDRVRIVQKPVSVPERKRRQRPLAADDARRLAGMLGDIDDPGLKAALERLGRAVMTGPRGK